MKFHLVAAVLATSAFAAPAFAAPTSGARVEAVLGYDNVSTDIEDFDDEGTGGILYGLGVGYDFAVGPTTSIGIDAEATESTSDIEFGDGEDSAELDAGRDLYVGGRITGALSPSFNLYGKLGYTNARIKGSVTIAGETVSESGNADGIRAGIGGQFALGGNAYLGAEYRYSNYEGSLQRHQVAGTVGLRF
ncbi:MAG TPA: porin family protein [Allosphingosinicella sp.]|nr:porin family protein [Allosphingosinicella sp.]